MSNPAFCGENRAFIYKRGGLDLVGELNGATRIRWNRLRDDISTCTVEAAVSECCEVLADVEPVAFELHIERDGELVWCGPITRLEFEQDEAGIYAEDMLWVAKRRVVTNGYNFGPVDEGGSGATNAVQLARNLLVNQCYSKNQDEWNMVPYVNAEYGPNGCDPQASRQVNAYSNTVWEEVDTLAADYGVDYTVVGRNIYVFSVQLNWNEIAALTESDIGDSPRIVEYGNSLATRFVRTDGSGYAGVARAPIAVEQQYARDIDSLSVEQQQAQFGPNGNILRPSPGRLARYARTARRRIEDLYPVRRAIVVPANSTLMPTSVWDVNTLTPGSWFPVTVFHPCRGEISEYNRLQEVVVEESGQDGELVQITTTGPPVRMILPDDDPCL